MFVVLAYAVQCVLVGVHSQLGISAIQSTMTTEGITESCQNGLGNTYVDVFYMNPDDGCGFPCKGWYNTSMNGGWRQIATFDNLPGPWLYTPWGTRILFIGLTEKHPDISTINENAQTLSACVVNDTSKECVFDVDVLVRKCGNDLTYYLDYVESVHPDWDIAYGFERKYINPCEQPLSNYAPVIEEVTDGFAIDRNTMVYGWYNYILNGQQYILPTVDDLKYWDWDNSQLDQQILHVGYSYWIPAIDGDVNYWMQLNESAVRLPVCILSTDILYRGCQHKSHDIYASKCSDGIRYFLDTTYNSMLLVNPIKKPIVIPQLHHDLVTTVLGGSLVEAFQPVIKFRCSYSKDHPDDETDSYIVNWYIDNELVVTRGPANNLDELKMDENDIPARSTGLGFNVTCGCRINGDKNEILSNNYFVGIKILDPDIQLSRRGSTIVRAQLTVPMGCLYPVSGESSCTYPFTLYDPYTHLQDCFGTLSITHAGIKALKRGETWGRFTIYGFMVNTVEQTYDDKTDYNLRFSVPDYVSHSIWQGYQQDGVKVKVTEFTTWSWQSYQNKMCYSVGDPHVKTTDGRYLEQQTEGDYMLLLNTQYQIEVQESTRFCSGVSGPVCECGIAVRAGQDVFMLDRCNGVYYLDFPYCGDGGILDVEVFNDYQYTVTTPIGTKVIINAWGRYLSTYIVMSAKDFESTRGLCGYFDGDRENDFILSDGSVTYDHLLFAKSWRLSDEMNLFTNSDRVLEQWSNINNITTQNIECWKSSSITQTKCRLSGQHSKTRRKRRAKLSWNEDIRKRSIVETISNSTAIKMCNDSVYNSPSVKYFSDMLNGAEDPNEVVKQCVFDVLASNDPNFTTLYVDALNSVVRTFIELSPVYAANNTQTVEQFLLESCSNNCSDQGECLVTGHCSCRGFYRGPDCSIDIRMPPTIQDIHDGGECDRASGELCECFIVRTDHLFEGFMFQLHTTRVYFDGDHEQMGYSIHTGNHEDIFTGTVCVPNSRGKRDDQQISDYVVLYDVSLSNDGDAFGTAMSVLVYDSTCHDVVNNGSLVDVNLKEGYCYITGTCIPDGTEDGCQICNSNELKFEWSLANCENHGGLSSAALIGISVASAVLALVIIAIIMYKFFFRTHKNRVESVPDLTTSGDRAPVSYNLHFTSKRSSTMEQP